MLKASGLASSTIRKLKVGQNTVSFGKRKKKTLISSLKFPTLFRTTLIRLQIETFFVATAFFITYVLNRKLIVLPGFLKSSL